MALFFYGDPHGEWRPLLRADLGSEDTVVIVGDCDLDVPLKVKLAPLFARGVTVRWIVGNHDTDIQQWYDNLTSYPEGDLHCRVQVLSGVATAGLGGIFKGTVWYPRLGDKPPAIYSRAERLSGLAHHRRWRKGLPLVARDAIYPEEYYDLAMHSASVLVSHEAPTTHQHGFPALDELGAAMGVRWHIHGHHHRSYEAALPGGKIRVKGLAKHELWRLPE